MGVTVLLLEDDRELRATLRDALDVEGYRVLAAASLADARAQLRHVDPARPVQLVLLDLGLPDGDGEALLRECRASLPAPVIVVSARTADASKIRLLDAGADDYLVKPFSLGELLARMRAALRHRGTRIDPALRQWSSGGVEVDLEARRVRRDGADVHLTPTEFRLLAALVRQAGRVLSHRALLADVWGPDAVDQTQYLRLYMGQLRAKLERQPADPRLLLTEAGVGYRLAAGDGAGD